MKKIACIGVVTADVVTRPVDRLPEPGQLISVNEITLHTGGCAINIAVDLKKMGFDSIVCCKVGKDSFGDFVIGELEKEGVDVSGILVDGNSTTASTVVCINSEGERSFLHNSSSNDDLTMEEIPETVLENADIVFIAGALLMKKFDGEPCAAFLKKAQEMGKFTALDTAWDSTGKWMQTLAPCLPYLDLFMPSYEEASLLSGEKDPDRIADKFMKMGAKNVVIKLGKDGCLIRSASGERFLLPTYKYIKPTDATGAGDSFCAGFIVGLAKGYGLEACGVLANAVGTHCIMEVGASTGIKSFDEIQMFIEKNKRKLLEQEA